MNDIDDIEYYRLEETGPDGQIHTVRYGRLKPCIFCRHTTAFRISGSSLGSVGSWHEGKCPANGNQEHIRPGQFPDKVLEDIKASRGIL